jgi:pimeloyl-ACP methyl ester carboxylesterase
VGLAERTASDVWAAGLPELMETDLRHAVERIVVPALVVVGEHDRVTPPAAAIALAGALPDGRLVVIPHAGHFPILERPAELDRELQTFARAALGSTARKPRGRSDRSKGGEA